ncbi:LCP family protein [Clostridium tertium]|uniref:LCP family protein n=1 Tax=Clostridium tertium TaxID=1559 RepID=UPI00232ED562|nr:LCP family protein [Clostridium tertium]MDB1944566.1 LCP family protein [Clostridium tertium]MDB1951833.1 LCP family protein [Clostridium tertium]
MRKLSKKKITIISLLIFILIIIGSIASYTYYLSSKVERIDIDRKEVTDTGKEAPKETEDVITIALLGSDFSELYDVSAADATMILSIDSKNNNIKLCSLMRDIYLDLPQGGKMNLNYTILDGGPSSILKTINYNFNLKIDKFVQVDLKRLPKIIDALGGVEIEITTEELQYINKYIDNIDKHNETTTEHIYNTGKQLLNGTQASAYCRIRYTAGRDFKRTERQRDVLNALFVKFKDVNLTEVPALINDILPLVTTNLSNSEIISISTKALSMGLNNIEQGRFPSDANIISAGFTDMYHTNIDIEGTTKELHKFIFSIKE